jgi:predicted Fe-S protein YdhL (DUF1289 family)
VLPLVVELLAELLVRHLQLVLVHPARLEPMEPISSIKFIKISAKEAAVELAEWVNMAPGERRAMLQRLEDEVHLIHQMYRFMASEMIRIMTQTAARQALFRAAQVELKPHL